jgi:hypothetical protein
MATYQPGVTDYISQIQPTEPNLAFDAQILQTKQTKFDANHQKISELYGSILNSSMSRNENIAARDQFVKNINTDIVKMAGMDFSLDENVDAAANVFQAIYNNNHIVKDMVWTKNFQNEKSRGEALRNCVDPDKCGGQAWDQGDQYMEYKLKEFKDASNDESLGFENVEYIPYTNMMDKAMKYAKDNKLEISSDQLIGNYMVTTKNGPQAYGPLAELFTNLYANDPKLLKQYEAQAYVTRKNNVGSIMSETGLDENAATSEYYRRQGTVQQEKINSILEQSNADEEYISGRISALEEKIKAGKVAKDSNLAKEYNALQQLLPGAQQASQYIKLAKMTAEKANDNTYIRNMASQLDSRDAAIFMHEDITGAAKSIADNTMTQKKEADEFAKLSVKHQYDVMMEGIKQSNRVALESHKASLKTDESNPFGTSTDGKEGKGNKLANTTVSAYLSENYKGPKLKGHWADEIKTLETVLTNNSSAVTGEKYKEAKTKLDKLRPLNEENIKRQQAQWLDKSGTKPVTGGSFSILYNEDKKASGRTQEDYKNKKSSAVTGVSKTLGTINGILTGTGQQLYSEPEVNAEINKNNGKRSTKAADLNVNPVAKKQAVQIIQESYIPLPKATTEKINAGDSKTIAIHTNKVVNAEKKKLVATKPVTKEMIQFVADSHANPSVQKAYKELSKKPIEKLSATEKKNIAAKYEKLNKDQSFDMTGAQTVSSESVASAYNKQSSYLNNTLGAKTKVVNRAYIETLDKNSAEYKLIKRQALNFIKQRGVENNNINKLREESSTREQGKKPVKEYFVANTKYKENEISDWGLMNLIENNSSFSQTLYKYNVQKKTDSPGDNPKLLKMLESPKVQKAQDRIADIQEDMTNHFNLKKEGHDDIVTKMKDGLDDYQYPFQKDVVKDGFLISKREFIKKNIALGRRDIDDLNEEYQTYTEKYHEGLSIGLKQTKNKSGVGPATYNIYESNNVHMYADLSPARNDAMNYINETFKASATGDRALFVNGNKITDKTEIQKYIGELQRSKDFYNLSYQLSGLTGLQDGVKDDWEGLSFYNTKTSQKITLATNPNARMSKMYDDRDQSTKDKSLQQTGRTILFRGNDLTNKKAVYVEKTNSGELKFDGVIHVDGKLEDLNTFLYNSDKDYYESLESYEDALGFLNDVFETQKKIK